MKKILICMILILCISVPAAFSQFRFELGANVLVAASSLSSGELGESFPLTGEDLFLVAPNMSLFYQANLGILKIGAGVKVQSLFLVAYAAYPAAQVEFALGSLSIDASVGGYYFGFYAIGEGFGTLPADVHFLIPDVSIWLGIGKKNTFRIGGGAIGLLPTSFDMSDIPFIAYVGAKIVLQ